MSDLVFILGAAAGFSALVAAVYWYKGSSIEPKPVWDIDPTLRPRNMQEHAFGVTQALDAANYWSSRANKIAAIWASAAAILTIAATVLAWSPSQSPISQGGKGGQSPSGMGGEGGSGPYAGGGGAAGKCTKYANGGIICDGNGGGGGGGIAGGGDGGSTLTSSGGKGARP